MHTHHRTPDTLAIVVDRTPQRGVTSVEIVHVEDGLEVEVFADFAPVPDAMIGLWLAVVVDVWQRTGPIAAAASVKGSALAARSPRGSAGRKS